MFVKMDKRGLEELFNSDEMVGAVAQVAQRVAGNINAPSRQTVGVRAGKGPRGPFAQAIMRGPGAAAIEFGSVNNAPLAPVRSAVMRSAR